MELISHTISCPYCGENIELLIDDSVDESDYYEDCSVCCRPIRVKLSVDNEAVRQILILREDD